MTSQFRRAAVSVAANIAEGVKKRGRQDKVRFLNTGYTGPAKPRTGTPCAPTATPLDVRKNYDLANDSYDTTWSEIDANCETCRGPGSRHVEWAEIPAMGRPDSEDFGLVVTTRDWTPGRR